MPRGVNANRVGQRGIGYRQSRHFDDSCQSPPNQRQLPSDFPPGLSGIEKTGHKSPTRDADVTDYGVICLADLAAQAETKLTALRPDASRGSFNE
jgi:hypothetical protein